MTARRIAASLLLLVAAGFLWIAVLTPLRSDAIAEFDAEAQRLGEEWRDAGEDLLDENEERDRLLEASNAAFERARDLEPPLGPIQAIGFALIAVAGGVALWPSSTTTEGAQPER